MAKTALIGFMGAGKTTAAHALGEGAVDVDEVIEARLGRRIQDVFAEDGEAAFREVEEKPRRWSCSPIHPSKPWR